MLSLNWFWFTIDVKVATERRRTPIFIEGHKYRVVADTLVLLLLVTTMLVTIITQIVHHISSAATPVYYGADLTQMTKATGVDFTHPATLASGGPWPQRTTNYCFLAIVQAMVNYADLQAGKPVQYPTQASQGPASGNPQEATDGQILHDMDTNMRPPGGSLPPKGTGKNRRPFTLANIAYDFGGDPRSQAFAIAYESARSLAPQQTHPYHEHIYHTDTQTATLGIAKALALYREPVVAFVNHGLHSVLAAGVWAIGNPARDAHAQIVALAIYNPWDIQGTMSRPMH